MTIAAVPSTGIDVPRVGPASDAAAGGFEDLLAGAQAQAGDETPAEPAVGTAAKRPVRTAPRDATRTTKDATDAEATDATETADGTTEQAPTDATDADTTSADAAPVVAPIVVPPVLPDSGVGQVVLEALADLEGDVDTEADAPVVVTSADLAEIVTAPPTVAADTAPEAVAATAVVESDAPADANEPMIVTDDARDSSAVAAGDTPAVDATPRSHAPAAKHAAHDAPADASAAEAQDAASGSAPEKNDAPAARPNAAATNATIATVDATATATATAAVAPTPELSPPDDTRRGPSEQASPTAIAAVTTREMPAVSRGAEVSTMHTTSAPAGAPPAEQLVSVLRPLRTAPDGSYRIRLELRPPELGRVELRVELRDGVLSASLHTDNEGAATTLQNALGDLRARLEATGVRAGALSVDDGRTSADRQAHRDAPRDRSNQTGPDNGGVTAPVPDAASSDSVLDVRL